MATRQSKKSNGGRPYGYWHGVRRHSRLAVCALIFVALLVSLIAFGMRPVLGVLFAFDVSTMIFLASTLRMILRSGTRSIHRRARKEDEGYWGFLLSSAGVAAVALIALVMELHAGKSGGFGEVALAGSTLLLSWTFLNTIFSLHYAHDFYGDGGGKRGGLGFPGTPEPDYWDFFYFAFVIGMTFQVSDVEISDRGIRRVALIHALIAFFFNVIIIALTVNVIAGIAG